LHSPGGTGKLIGSARLLANRSNRTISRRSANDRSRTSSGPAIRSRHFAPSSSVLCGPAQVVQTNCQTTVQHRERVSIHPTRGDHSFAETCWRPVAAPNVRRSRIPDAPIAAGDCILRWWGGTMSAERLDDSPAAGLASHRISQPQRSRFRVLSQSQSFDVVDVSSCRAFSSFKRCIRRGNETVCARWFLPPDAFAGGLFLYMIRCIFSPASSRHSGTARKQQQSHEAGSGTVERFIGVFLAGGSIRCR